MASFQETVLLWRYQGQNTWKTVVGFWLKAVIELVLMIGLPLGVFIFVLTTLAELSLGAIPLVNETRNPRLIGWIVLTASTWLQLRCIYADRVDVDSLVDRSRESPAEDTSDANSSKNADGLKNTQHNTK